MNLFDLTDSLPDWAFWLLVLVVLTFVSLLATIQAKFTPIEEQR